MANTTFSGSVRSKAGFNVINESSTTGAITETGFSVNSTGQLYFSLLYERGKHQIQDSLHFPSDHLLSNGSGYNQGSNAP